MSSNFIQSLCFSDLPEDVGRLIFELAAELDRETGRSCALVSRKANAWTEPIIYRTLIIQDQKKLKNLCGIVEDVNHGDSTKSPDFFATRVKAIVILIDHEKYAANILSILKACHNVEMLALWDNPLDPYFGRPNGRDLEDLRDFINSPELSLRWISISSKILPIGEVHFSYPVFRNATHVELLWGEEDNVPDEVCWATLRYLPFLTHLSVYCPSFMVGCGRWVRETVDLCPRSLQIFILWIHPLSYFRDTNAEFEGLKAIQDGHVDSRVVVAYMGESSSSLSSCQMHPILRSYPDAVKDWAGIPVGKDFWTLAEEFIKERHRQRETQVSLEFLISCFAN